MAGSYSTGVVMLCVNVSSYNCIRSYVHVHVLLYICLHRLIYQFNYITVLVMCAHFQIM